MQIKDLAEDEINRRIEKLYAQRPSFKPEVYQLAEAVLNCGDPEDLQSGALFTFDILAFGVANSLLRLSNALTSPLDTKDFIICSAMIRMMVDPVITLYGASKASISCHDYAMHLMGGGQISEVIGKDGKKLTYSSLCRSIDAEYELKFNRKPDIHQTYKTACSGVHFSSWHIFSHFWLEENHFTGRISDENIQPMRPFQVCEMLMAEAKIWNCYFWLLESWRLTKLKPKNIPNQPE